MSRIKISSSLIILLAVLLLGFSSVVQAEEVPKGPNGELLPVGIEGDEKNLEETSNLPPDEISGIGAGPGVPTLENSIELKDEPVENKESENVQPVVIVSDSQAVSSWKENAPFLAIIIVMVLAAVALLIFAFRKFKERK